MNPNIAKEGENTQFKEGESGNPNGRPRKIYTILKKSGYSKDDMNTAFHELAWMSLDQLKEVFERKDSPVIIQIVAATFKEALSKKDYSRIREIIEQTIGKPKQAIEMTGDSVKIRVSVKKNNEGNTD